MAMDVQPATHVLAGPEPQQAYGAFPEPWLAGESMYPPPSPSLLEKLQELAAMLDDIEAGGSGGAGGGAEADAPDAALCPAEEDVAFRPIVRGQLDCSRCRTVREVVTLNGRHKQAHVVLYLHIYIYTYMYVLCRAEQGAFHGAQCAPRDFPAWDRRPYVHGCRRQFPYLRSSAS
jgi:hypothetical protein